jgi:hypothetical protein
VVSGSGTGSAAASASATVESVEPSATPVAWLPTPGRPYDAAGVLSAMRLSPRPGGVPDQLERDDIAAAVAEQLWTGDGEPWNRMVAGGSCGTQTCTLEISGSVLGTDGEDLYLFSVEPAAGSVTLTSAELRAIPPAVVAQLDQFARARWPDAPIPGPLASARWLPPPDEGVFVLSYRSGGEEGSPAVDARVDVPNGTVRVSEPAHG